MFLLKGIGIASGVVFTIWIGWGAFMTLNTPKPPYSVVQTIGSDVEIREYEAQTWISAPAGEDNASFRILASYIFGNNERDQKIAMTAPVISDERMSFILPEDLSAATAPTPNGQPIEFTNVPKRRVATLQFSWWTDTERVNEKTQTLLGTLARDQIETTGEPFLMRYNDPWTPPFMRRNEVAIVVKQGTPASGA